MSPLVDQAHSFLTLYAFKIFQEEFGRATQYSVLQENCIEFVLQYYKDETNQRHKVLWDGKMKSGIIIKWKRIASGGWWKFSGQGKYGSC